MARNAKLREEHKRAVEKPKFDNARRLRGIHFIYPEDKEFKETPMAPAMLCKTCKKSKNGETRSKTNDFKSKFVCILEASEPTRMRMEIHYQIIMRTILQKEVTTHYKSAIWYRNLSYASSNEDTRSKSSSG